MFCEKLTFQQYKKLKTRINNFVSDLDWRWCLTLNSLITEEFCVNVLNIIDELSKEISNEKLNLLLDKIRAKSLGYLEKAKHEINVTLKWQNARLAFAYYGIIEAITENSAFEKKIINEIKQKYGDKYLKRIEQLDKENPSTLTMFNGVGRKNQYQTCDIRYLILKTWQDSQNVYFNKNLNPILSSARNEFDIKYNKEYGIIDCGPNEKLVLEYLRAVPFVTADTLACLIDVGVENELASVVGGKAYGLAVLKSKGIFIPETYFLPVNKKFNKELEKILKPNKKYAVRSSADCEDGEKNSYAGMFESYLNIDVLDIGTSVNKVYDSVKSERLKSYIKPFKLQQPEMAVIIQEFYSAETSGVWIGNSVNSGMLEWTYGIGDDLVLGKVIPKIEEHPNVLNDGISVKGQKVGKLLLNYQNQIGAVCDFEWCIKNNQLIMLQYRPVTTMVVNKKTAKQGDVKGTPASSGKVMGKICFLEDRNQIEKFEPNSILLTYYTDPNWVEVMTKAKGIITAQGGFLCHTAIIARELGIPCITGVGDEKIEFLSKQKEILLDATNGIITLKKNSIQQKNNNENNI